MAHNGALAAARRLEDCCRLRLFEMSMGCFDVERGMRTQGDVA